MQWDIERGLVIIPWVLKTSKSWNNDPERVFQYQSYMIPMNHEWAGGP